MQILVKIGQVAAIGWAMMAAPLAAETLSVEGYHPAASEAALGLRTVAVERFSGEDGARFSLLVSDRLRQTNVAGQPWFTVLVASRAGEADAVLEGDVTPRFSRQEFTQDREICWAEDADGTCVERREVELDCLRITINVRPQMRLVSYDGELLWTSRMERSEQLSFCPAYDSVPDADPAIDAMLEDMAAHMRHEFAPGFYRRPIRIMESRNNLAGDARQEFRDAVRLTKEDESAACVEFLRLFQDNPQQDSLTFNAGLCAERRGDFAAANTAYGLALRSERSDDEASAGLRRIENTLRARQQIEIHFGQ